MAAIRAWNSLNNFILTWNHGFTVTFCKLVESLMKNYYIRPVAYFSVFNYFTYVCPVNVTQVNNFHNFFDGAQTQTSTLVPYVLRNKMWPS